MLIWFLLSAVMFLVTYNASKVCHRAKTQTTWTRICYDNMWIFTTFTFLSTLIMTVVGAYRMAVKSR